MAAPRLAKMAASFAASAARASTAGAIVRAPSVFLVPRQRVSGLAAITHRCLGAQATQPFQFNSFSASVTAFATDIAAIVSDELKYEQENYTKPPSTLPEGWELTEKDGSSKVSLTKDFGDEVVQVDFTAREYDQSAFDEEDDDEDDEEEDEDPDEEDMDGQFPPDSITMEVCIVKEGSNDALIFEVETDGQSMDIVDVSLDKMKDDGSKEGEEEDEEDYDSIYGGPVFSELDPRLQEAFTDYLEERGVNAELGRFAMDFSEDKEQREYMNWLKAVQKFLK